MLQLENVFEKLRPTLTQILKMVEEPKKVQKRISEMLEHKVPVLKISKVSPDIIAAWKYPKMFENTVHNQFMRCSKYYVRRTIDNVLPLIKNIEHSLATEQIKHKTSDFYKLKVMMDEAQKFIGNADLTKRTRGQRKLNYAETTISSTTSTSIVTRNKKLPIDNKSPPAKKNIRAPDNNPNLELEDTDCIDLNSATPLNLDIEYVSVEAVPEITVPINCEPSSKVNLNRTCCILLFSPIIDSRLWNHN